MAQYAQLLLIVLYRIPAVIWLAVRRRAEYWEIVGPYRDSRIIPAIPFICHDFEDWARYDWGIESCGRAIKLEDKPDRETEKGEEEGRGEKEEGELV